MQWMKNPNQQFKAMRNEDKGLKVLRNHQKYGSLEMLRIPYKGPENNPRQAGQNVGFYVLLDRTAENLEATKTSLLTGDNAGINKFYDMKNDLAIERGEMLYSLPKFELEATYQPKEILGKLGFPLTITALAHEPLAVDDVIHKAVCKVDERGTEAAAATAIMMLRCSMPMRQIDPFFVDRPFVFYIYDDLHDQMLFTGFLGQPEFVEK